MIVQFDMTTEGSSEKTSGPSPSLQLPQESSRWLARDTEYSARSFGMTSPSREEMLRALSLQPELGHKLSEATTAALISEKLKEKLKTCSCSPVTRS